MPGAWWQSPILQSVIPVIEGSHSVHLHLDEIERVANWMAAEEWQPLDAPAPANADPFFINDDPNENLDLILFANSLDFAFTNFSTSQKFEIDYLGQRWSDSEAMGACLHRAILAGEPILDGAWSAKVDRAGIERLFRAEHEIPMVDERVAVLNEVGAVLADKYEGRWHKWVASCTPALFAGGDGLLERMETEFPRFRDTSIWHGKSVKIQKLAQLGLWIGHRALTPIGKPLVRDPELFTAFADYIVPLALHTMGITSYEPKLEARITAGEMIDRDSDEEIEIRAHTVYATALLTDAINLRRPAGRGLIIPEVDYRLWKSYHASHVPHHLTRTIMY